MGLLEEIIKEAGLPLCVQSSPHQGRFLVASRLIPKGAVVVEDIAFASVIEEDKIQYYCDACYSFSQHGKWDINCGECNRVYYCSNECRDKEKSSHESECKHLKALDTSVLHGSYYCCIAKLLVRIISRKRTGEKRVILPKTSFSNQIEVDFSFLGELFGHPEMATTEEAQTTINHSAGLIQADKADRDLLTQIFCAEETNSFGLWGMGGYGIGLFSFLSYFNHSCSPNLLRREKGNSIELVAGEDIPAGTEVCISYVDIERDYTSRQQELKKVFLFDCGCGRCRYEGEHKSPAKLPEHLTSLTCNDPQCVNCSQPLKSPSSHLPFPLREHCLACGSERLHAHLWVRHKDPKYLASK